MTNDDILRPVIEEKRRYGLQMQPPCPTRGLEILEQRARKELGVDLDPEYLALLSRTNGLDHNGVVFYASATTPIAGYEDRFVEGLVEANLGLRDVPEMSAFLVYGTSGEVHYVARLADKKFIILDAASLDVFETFATFGELLAAALKEYE